ncbi:uncharacterized protein DSM5745_10412 [Aspergillus mulundensis]|uniref:Uncharacterized protein n=1 Tax=Aspergillus mulundensis TaxID=1810919 RepID=A0A3D8QJ90_9EURO|nr:hypothetical protein DSM5745_10412 [Aspergillus mulundensis]RDW61740.1 hypothetical protein DSM5745_10412 [Aspergillus mulundensis]
MHFSLPLTILTALAAVTAAAPAPGPDPNGAFPADTWTRKVSKDGTRIAASLQSRKDDRVQIWLTVQHECVALDDKKFVNGVLGFSIPDGYRCRFWESKSCNGNGTPDIQAPGKVFEPRQGKVLNSFKCYKN